MSRLRALSILTAAWWVGGATGFVAAAGAQEPTKQERVRAAFSGEAARELERLLADARDRGLPTEPLLDKALEGSAKGVPAERVLAVLAQLSTGLGRARAILAEDGSPPVPADVVAVADGLRRGVPERAVSRLRTEAGPDEPIALAVHTLADLLDRGVPVDAALDVLTAWRSHGAQPTDLAELPAAVERLVRQGSLPSQAAEAVAAAVRAGRGPAGALPHQAGPPGRGRGRDGPPIPPGAGPPAGKGQGKGKGNNNPPGGSGL